MKTIGGKKKKSISEQFFWKQCILKRCIITWRKNKSVKVCVIKGDTEKQNWSGKKIRSRQSHCHWVRRTCNARERKHRLGEQQQQQKKKKIDGDDNGGEGRQTDPVVDFPKHCFLSYTFFRHRMFLTAETKVMMWQRREIQRRSFSRFAFRRGREGGSSSRVGGLEDDRMEVEEGGNKERRSKSVCRWTKESSVANRGTEIKTSTHINIYIYI